MKKFSCYLIGKDNLLIECGKILLAHGHNILGVFSKSISVITWVNENEIPLIHDLSNFESIVNRKKPDYLFSIINDQVLNNKIISSPLCFAINYHDSLLPQYAGVHATSWAILNGEKHHGITWHVMENGIDEGQILTQSSIYIDPEDTAFTLNLKCYSNAISSFTHLISLLSNEAYCLIPQNIQQRTYYGLYKKPKNYGWVNWNLPASKIKNLVHSLDFGNYENSLTTAKCLLSETTFIIGKIKILADSSKLSPGTIIEFDENGMILSTKTQNIHITELRTINGEIINIASHLEKNHIGIKSCLVSFLPNYTNKDHKTLDKVNRNEKFWVSELLKMEDTYIPFLSTKTYYNNVVCIHKFKLNGFNQKISESMHSDFKMPFNTLSLILIYLTRINNKNSVSVLFGNQFLSSMANKYKYMLSSLIPLTTMFPENTSFLDAADIIQRQVTHLEKHLTFYSDLYVRYPKLKNTVSPTIAIVIADNIEPYQNRANLIFKISLDGKNIDIFVKNEALTEETEYILKNISEQIKIGWKIILSNTKQNIYTLPVITKKERDLLIYKWNDTKTHYPKNKNIGRLFEKQAELYSNKAAIVMEDLVLSFTELNNASNQLAHFFLESGMKPSQPVCIVLERSIDLVTTILAIIKLGGIYIPIDPDYPDERINHIIKECRPKLCVSHSRFHKKLFSYIKKTASLLLLDKNIEQIKKQEKSNLFFKIHADDLVNIMYTSGSTGKPKGIQITHRGIIRLVKNTNFVGVKETDCVACIANPMFDASTFELWSSLLNGAKLIIISKEIVSTLEYFHKELIKNEVTILLLTSAFFDFIVNTAPNILSKIDTLIIVGDTLSPVSVQKILLSNHGPKRIINGYGPTENTGATTFYELNSLSDFNRSIPIGKPVSNTTVYVCDNNNQLLPIGATGELLTGGDGLAKGYVNKPELTKEKFIKNPFKKKGDSILYKTGDLVRWLPNGNLEYINRSDNLVKIRGFRIELSEIEHVLLTHPSVINSSVSIINNPGESKKIVAWLILKEKNTLSANEIKNFLSLKLPDYMHPAVYVFLEKFPLTLNGKIDKEKLFYLLSTKTDEKNETHLPIKEPHLSLVKIWRHIFKKKNIGIYDNFFELGGDSIVAMQIQFEARQAGIHTTVKDIFSYQNIEKLSHHIRYLKDTHETSQRSSQTIPLSPIQSWFFEQDLLKKEQFSQYCIIEINKKLPPSIVKKHINTIIETNDCFHLTYSNKNTEWSQFYSKRNPESFELLNIDIIDPKPLKDNRLLLNVAYELQAKFNLSTGPLFLGAIVKMLNSDKLYLLLVAHHLIFDGVSWRIFLNTLDTICSGNMSKFSANHGFVDWSLYLRNIANKLEWQKEFYLSICSKKIPIKYDHQKGGNFESSSHFVEQALTTKETNTLLEVAQKHQIRLDEILIAVCVKVLCEWQNLNEIIIDIERHGRENLDTKLDPIGILGWFTSLFPTYFLHQADLNSQDYLQNIKAQLKNIHNNGVDFGILKYILNHKPQLKVESFISFNYWGQFDGLFDKNSNFSFKELNLISHPDNLRTHQINIESLILANQLKIRWIYSKNFYKKNTIEKICQNTFNKLKSLILETKDDEDPLSSLNKNISSSFEKQTTYDISESIKDPYPLSSIQSGLLFHSINTPGCEAYAVQLIWEASHDLNLYALKESLYFLVKRHPILRAYFEWKDQSQPIQYIAHAVELPWQEYDWTSSSSINQHERFELFLKADRQTNFSLSRAPLMRVSIIKLPREKYKIILSMHHILLDGWSMSVLIKELNQIYGACLSSQSISLVHPPLFFDYILWLQNHNISSAKRKWKKYLKEFYIKTDLPIVKKLTLSSLINYQEQNLEFNTQTSIRISSFCQNYQVTLSTLLQSTWAILLSKYSNQHDIVFGVTVSVRPSSIENIENMIGPAINTIPFRVKINEQQNIINFLTKIQENFIEISEYATSSLTDIHAWSQIEKGSHLFDTILVVENYPSEIISTKEVVLKNPKIIDPTHYPLSIIAAKDLVSGNLTIRFSYDLNQVDCHKLQIMIKHFQILVLNILDKPLHQLLEIDIMSTDEKNMVLHDWNNTNEPYDKNALVSDLIEMQAAQTPSRIALSFDGQTLTYQELNQFSNQLARYLIDLGVGPNTPVGICLSRGLNVVISMLGIVKAGGFYIPIDPDYPKDRIQHMLADSCASFIITESRVQINTLSINSRSVTMIVLDHELSTIQKKSVNNLQSVINSENLIYTIYTSGSTGKPKGVMIKHHALINFLHSMQKILQLSQEDKWLAVTPISFDISGLELFLPLIIGAQCVLASKNVIVDGKKLTQKLSEEKITILQATPMTWSMLLEAGWCNSNNLKILCGGEPLRMKLCNELLAQSDQILNLYGPTETTIWSSYYKYKRGDSLLPIAPIGKPIKNTRFYVLDKHLKLVPIGMIGELHIGGEGLALGYFNQPELTREKFIPDPFAGANSLLYKTGDLVSWHPEGYLEYIGRTDEQIKIRGHRIELGEIQNQIEMFDEIQQSIVLLDKKDQQDPKIIACLIQDKKQKWDESILRNNLKNFLPPHMIPQNFILFDKFPLTPNKKVDKIRLLHLARKYLASLNDIPEEIDPPRTPEEKKLSEIWSRVLVLPIKKINRNDNFFDLGGHSLNALHVLSEIHQVFHLDLEVRVLFEFPTLAQLANKIASNLTNTLQFLHSNTSVSKKPIDACLVPLKITGKKRPLFLIHPVGGTVFWYIHLAKYFDIDRPMYGIQDPGIHTDTIPFDSIPELAEFYIKIIKKTQPYGPYLLGGASAGANISMEIAAQLKQQNQKVGFIGLLDGWAYYPKNLEDRELFENLMMRQYYIMEQQFIDYGISLPRKLLQLQWHRSQLNRNYLPPVLDMRLYLFKAREVLPIFESIDSPFNHWENYSILPIHLEVVAGDHETMFNESNAKILSQKISQLIDKTSL